MVDPDWSQIRQEIAANALNGLDQTLQHPGSGAPPVHLWNPPDRGDIGMHIARDGTWSYLGSPIRRASLVRLFASILRREEDGLHYLVTPVEKCLVKVDDAALVIVVIDVKRGGGGQLVLARSNLGDQFIISEDHPLRAVPAGEPGEIRVYAGVRNGLEALFGRQPYYDLVEAGEVRRIDEVEWFGVQSSETFWPLLPASEAGLELDLR